MRAARLEKVGSIKIVSIPDPVAGPEEIVVGVEAAGMCGTDRHILKGEYPARPPVTLGHELEGRVHSVGPDTSLRVGTRVTVDPNISCGYCRYCRLGLVAHCDLLSAIGVDRDGGFASYVVVPERQAYQLPASVPIGHGALCEPLACCLRALDHAMVRPGCSVAVFGGGVIGQLLVQLARLGGATTIALSTRQEKRRALAESFGATATIDPAASDAADMIAGPGGVAPGGVDVVFEAAGVAETFQQALRSARRAGRVVVVGVAPKGLTVPINPFDLFARELRIQGSYLNPLTHGRAAELVSSGCLELGPLITRTVSLDEVPGVLDGPPLSGDTKTVMVPQ